LKVFKQVAERTASGRLFHTRAAATPNARSPTMVLHRVRGTISLWVADDRRRCQELLSAAKCRCQVRQHDVTMTAEDEYGQSDFNTPRGTQPMQVVLEQLTRDSEQDTCADKNNSSWNTTWDYYYYITLRAVIGVIVCTLVCRHQLRCPNSGRLFILYATPVLRVTSSEFKNDRLYMLKEFRQYV